MRTGPQLVRKPVARDPEYGMTLYLSPLVILRLKELREQESTFGLGGTGENQGEAATGRTGAAGDSGSETVLGQFEKDPLDGGAR